MLESLTNAAHYGNFLGILTALQGFTRSCAYFARGSTTPRRPLFAEVGDVCFAPTLLKKSGRTFCKKYCITSLRGIIRMIELTRWRGI